MQFTTSQLSSILHINNTALSELVNRGKIPYDKIQTSTGINIRFNPNALDEWLKGGPKLKMDTEKYIERFRKRIEGKYPGALKELKKFGGQFSEPRQPKGYNLTKVPNRKLGFVYYARYIVNGKLIPSRWCTHTNNQEAAARWAIENKERLLSAYYNRDKVQKPYGDFYTILRKYYAENSPYLQIDNKRGRIINEHARITYHNFIINQFIPYLRRNRIKELAEIDTPLLARFQNYLLADKKTDDKIVPGIKPQTINHYISYISQIFDHLLIEGHIKTNPCRSLISLKITKDDLKETGCYEINKLKGVFNKKWENELSYLLSMLIYTTDMRNSEIERIQVKDLIMIDTLRFINIPESKSSNGVRIVPLHDFVYRKLTAYIRKNKLDNDDFIFKLPNRKRLGSDIYKKAYTELARYTKYSIEKLKEENITFYSGRHFWKTLMNSENLGDVEEYFMGHKISADVAKRYNHRDKQGKRKLLEKARKVFQILDKYIFLPIK